MAKRTPALDAAMWTLIYGGSSAAKLLAVCAIGALGLVNPAILRGASRIAGYTLKHAQNAAWTHYESTGDLKGAIGILIDRVF